MTAEDYSYIYFTNYEIIAYHNIKLIAGAFLAGFTVSVIVGVSLFMGVAIFCVGIAVLNR